jgi:hypothetical protein
MSATLHTLKAEVRPDGTVHVFDPPTVNRPVPAIITFVSEDEDADAALLSEAALSDWNRVEEDEAWAHLQ